MLPENMRCVEIREPGKPDVLVMGERSVPIPDDHQVLVKVAAAGVNGPDLIQRRGHYPPPEGASDLLGLEVSGEVVGTGSAVTRLNLGDSICALTNGGGYAEYVAIDENHCLPIPKQVSTEDAAGIPETHFTVWSNCFYTGTTEANSIFLVHGGAGGIGSTAIQLGAALGLRVFTTCAAKNIEYCSEKGAERSIDYKEEDFVEIVREAGGASLILDIIGGDYIAKNFKAARADAKIVQLAFNHGSKVDINLMPIMLKRLTLTGSTLRSRPAAFKAAIAADLHKNVWPQYETGTLKTHTHAVLPFSEAIKAHELMEQTQHRGKILLKPD